MNQAFVLEAAGGLPVSMLPSFPGHTPQGDHRQEDVRERSALPWPLWTDCPADSQESSLQAEPEGRFLGSLLACSVKSRSCSAEVFSLL